MVGGLDRGPQARQTRPHDHTVGEELIGRDRVHVDEIPPGLAETDPFGLGRALALVALLHDPMAFQNQPLQRKAATNKHLHR